MRRAFSFTARATLSSWRKPSSKRGQARATALAAGRTATLGYADMKSKADWAARYPDDEDEQREFDEKMRDLEADLQEKPVVYDTAAAIFVNGGE